MRKIKIESWLKKYGYKSLYELAKKYDVSQPSLGRWNKDEDYRMYDQSSPVFIHSPITINELELRECKSI